MAGGQIGCAWSHKKIYIDIIEKQYSKVLILEDDVFASENMAIENTENIT